MLHGNKINLRLIGEGDIEWLREARNKHVEDFFTKDQITPQQQRAWYQKYSENVTDRMFVVETKDGTPVGTIALYNVNVADRTANIGRTLLLPEYRGNGYMEEAVKMLVTEAFDKMRLWSLRLGVYLDNAAAISLYHKCGFKATPRPIMLMEAENYDKDHMKPFRMTEFDDGD